MGWRGFALLAIAAGVVGIASWQVWESEQLKIPKWMETDRPDCQVWDPYPQRNESATWTGDCKSGKAEGRGTLTWNYADPAGNLLAETYSVGMVAGKLDGPGTATLPNGEHFEGAYRNGDKTGHGVFQWTDGRYDGEWKNDKPDGPGTYTEANGATHTGQWKQGCLEEGDDMIALNNDMEACRKILRK